MAISQRKKKTGNELTCRVSLVVDIEILKVETRQTKKAKDICSLVPLTLSFFLSLRWKSSSFGTRSDRVSNLLLPLNPNLQVFQLFDRDPHSWLIFTHFAKPHGDHNCQLRWWLTGDAERVASVAQAARSLQPQQLG